MRLMDIKKIKNQAEVIVRRVNRLPVNEEVSKDHLHLVDRAFSDFVMWECLDVILELKDNCLTSHFDREKEAFYLDNLYKLMKRRFHLREKDRPYYD